MLDMPRFWIARLNLKWNCGCNDRNFMSDLFQIFMRILMVMTVLQKEQCSVTFPGLARSPLQKSNWFSQSSTCTDYVIKLVAHPCAFASLIFRRAKTPQNISDNFFFPSSTISTWRRCGRLRKSTSFWLLFSVTTWVMFDLD